MKHDVSDEIFKIAKQLLKEGKTVPLIKYKYNPQLKVGSIIKLKGKTTTSIRVKVVDIKKYVINKKNDFSIPEEIKSVYNEFKLKAMFNGKRARKVYIIYVRRINGDGENGERR